MSDGPSLLDTILKGGPEANSGAVANDLLKAFFRGYPISNLRTLLASEVSEQVRTGAWILSELGNRGSELRDVLPALLRHTDSHVRFYAVDSALSCCTEQDGETVAIVIRLLEDAHRGVRYKVADFLMRADQSQLRGALTSMEAGSKSADGDAMSALRWLLSDASGHAAAVQQLLEEESAIARKVALAAAVKLHDGGADLLRLAAASADPEIAELARRRQNS